MMGLDFNDAPPPKSALQTALRYARAGIPVFPCNPLNKQPLVKRGFKEATTDEFRVKAWWTQWPHAMIGAPMGSPSGLVALDIDNSPERGKFGLKSISDFGHPFEELADNPHTRTASGGYHVFFKFDPARPITNARGSLPQYVDIRGEGGYVIMAGSTTAERRPYRAELSIDEAEVADAPEWLYAAVKSNGPASASFDFNQAKAIGDNAAARAEHIPPGQWHERTRDLIARMTREGASDETIMALAPHFTEPGYTVADTRRDFAAHIRTARDKWGYQPKPVAPGSDARPDGRKLRALTIDELADLQPPEWLIDGLIPAKAFVSLYGPHASLKSFVALDWGLCIAHGRPWMGSKPIKPGAVLYVAGEGQHGLAQRILGWRHAKGLSDTEAPFRVVPQAVAMPTTELHDLIALAKEEPPILIVLDTLARTFGAGDENAQKDMNAYVAAVDRLRGETGATVLVIHHSGKDEDKGSRGSTALPGAVDASVFVRRKAQSMTLINKGPRGKQKDAEEHEDIKLRTQVIDFEHRGAAHKTLILMPDDAPVGDRDGDDANEAEPVQRLGPRQKAVMTALEQAARDGQSLGFTRLVSMTGLDRGSLGRVLRDLTEKGIVKEVETGGSRQWMFT